MGKQNIWIVKNNLKWIFTRCPNFIYLTLLHNEIKINIADTAGGGLTFGRYCRKKQMKITGSKILNPKRPLKGYFLYFTTWALFYHLLTSKWVVKFLVFKIAPVGSYGPAKMRSSSHIPSKVNGAPFEISKYKSDGVASLILTLLKCEKNIYPCAWLHV